MVAFNLSDEQKASSDWVTLQLDDFREACVRDAEKIRASGIDATDVRFVAVHRLKNISQTVLALRIFHQIVYPTEVFWKSFFVAVPSSTDFTDFHREHDMFIRIGATQGIFSAMESDVRTVVLGMDSTACGGATAQFDGLSKWLLARATTLAPFADFIELFRLVRNTTHNNGVHRPPNGKDATVALKGKTYHFIVGKLIDFAGWDLTLLLFSETLNFLVAIATDPTVSAIPRIDDPPSPYAS